MGKVKALVVGSVLGAFAVSAFAMTASAADTRGTLAIVNGIPGSKVDVCLNGQEIKSKLSYGGKVFRNDIGTGHKSLRFYKHDPRRCGGTQVAQANVRLDPAEDLTIVATKRAPKVVIFDNALLGEIPARGVMLSTSPVAFRNAADLAADIIYHYWSDGADAPVTPSDVFLKGQQYTSTFIPDYAIRTRAGVGPRTVSAPIIQLIPSRRYEWIVVGTNASNARIVILDRQVSAPSP